jgi:hypothetical protein
MKRLLGEVGLISKYSSFEKETMMPIFSINV